jgi:hypothetical protein
MPRRTKDAAEPMWSTIPGEVHPEEVGNDGERKEDHRHQREPLIDERGLPGEGVAEQRVGPRRGCAARLENSAGLPQPALLGRLLQGFGQYAV